MEVLYPTKATEVTVCMIRRCGKLYWTAADCDYEIGQSPYDLVVLSSFALTPSNKWTSCGPFRRNCMRCTFFEESSIVPDSTSKCLKSLLALHSTIGAAGTTQKTGNALRSHSTKLEVFTKSQIGSQMWNEMFWNLGHTACANESSFPLVYSPPTLIGAGH